MYYYTRKNAFGQIKFSILGLSHLFFVSPLSVIPVHTGIHYLIIPSTVIPTEAVLGATEESASQTTNPCAASASWRIRRHAVGSLCSAQDDNVRTLSFTRKRESTTYNINHKIKTGVKDPALQIMITLLNCCRSSSSSVYYKVKNRNDASAYSIPYFYFTRTNFYLWITFFNMYVI